MRLYDDPCSGNGYKVRLILALLGRDYDYVPLDIDKAETRTPRVPGEEPQWPDTAAGTGRRAPAG